MAWRFVVSESSTPGQYWWTLQSENNKLTAWSGETFASSFNATRAAQAFKAGVHAAHFEVYEDKTNSWRWRAWRSSDKVAASGEAFSSKYNAERAVDAVKADTPDANGV